MPNIEYCDSNITKCEKALNKLPTMTEISNPKFNPANPKKVTPTVHKSEVSDIEWNTLINAASNYLANKIYSCKASRQQRNTMLEKWKPV